VTLSLALTRKGIDWEHRLRATGDYQRSNGRTSREQLLASWEPRYQIGKNLFAFSLAQYERDRFQGFSARYSLSGGIGYKLIDGKAAQLAVKVGPSWRQVEFLDGTSDNAFGALAGVDFDWRFAKGLTLTQDTNLVADTGGAAIVFVDATSTSILATTGLEAKVSDRLTTRLAYTLDYNSNPPPSAVSTDTQTRFTLVYDF
jgi:putative salt-induced outer membrane protein